MDLNMGTGLKNFGRIALQKAMKEANTPDNLVRKSLTAFSKSKDPTALNLVLSKIPNLTSKARDIIIKAATTELTTKNSNN